MVPPACTSRKVTKDNRKLLLFDEEGLTSPGSSLGSPTMTKDGYNNLTKQKKLEMQFNPFSHLTNLRMDKFIKKYSNGFERCTIMSMGYRKCVKTKCNEATKVAH